MRVLLVGLAACGATSASPAKPIAPSPAPIEDHELHVDIATSPNGLHAKLVGHAAQLDHAPIADWLGTPMAGTADVALDVVVPVVNGARDFRGAKGTFDLHCIAHCTIGDDAASPGLGSPAFHVGTIALDELELHATFGDGKLAISKWTIRSQDLELTIAGRLDLAAALTDSVVTGCVRFRAPSITRGDATVAKQLTAALGAPIASDGFYNIRLAGHLGSLRQLAQVCDGSVPIQPDFVPDITPSPPPAAPTDTDVDAEMTRGIRKLSATKYEIDRAVIERVLANPMRVMNGARVVPAVKDGKPRGFKLYAIRPSSIFARLGFENGDTLVKVNGFEMTSADQALEVYTKLRDATAIEVEIERHGKPMTLDYSIQ